MSKVLIVEDEARISRFVQLELEHEGYTVTACGDGLTGLETALREDFDILLLDIMLPGLNGIEVLKGVKEVKNTPVMILTARDKVMDKVTGLDVGADDYMTKPFAIEELLARMRNLLKRKEGAAGKVIGLGKLQLNLNEMSVSFDGEIVPLTKKEYELLIYLVQNKHKVIGRDKLLSAVWGYDFYGDTNIVDVYIRYLRSKIDDKYGVKLIHTVRGSGYIIKEEQGGGEA